MFPGRRAHSSPEGWCRLRAAVGLLLHCWALSGKSRRARLFGQGSSGKAYRVRLLVLQVPIFVVLSKVWKLGGVERERLQKMNRYYSKVEQGSRAITKGWREGYPERDEGLSRKGWRLTTALFWRQIWLWAEFVLAFVCLIECPYSWFFFLLI